MKVGDLVKFNVDDGPYGFVMRVDKEYFGAGNAFKIVNAPRGICIAHNKPDAILPTEKGIRDRILVLWSAGDRPGLEYCESTDLEVVSESR